MKCSFCGKEFNEIHAHGCGPCPMRSNCGKVKCPHCGFEMPQENIIWRWFRRRRGSAGKGRGLQRRHRRQECMLSQLAATEEAVISRIDTGNPRTLNKIMALGILPGMKVTMIQKYPSFVFQVGNTRVTADENMVNDILVQKE